MKKDTTTAGADIALGFINTLFAHTDDQKGKAFVQSLGNERGGRHKPRYPTVSLAHFMKEYDVAERGMFYCVSTIASGNQRNKNSVREITSLFADVDLKDVDETVESVEKKLLNLVNAEGKPFRPSIIVRSGNGVHAYWLLTEPVALQEDGAIDRIEGDLRILADLVGGDLAVCEVARLMRLPGSHNTKRGEWTEVTITHQSEVRYELDDLEEMLAEKSPIILRKVRPVAQTLGQLKETDPYTAYYREHGIKTPINVQERLDAMMYMGFGEAAIHATQIAVAASLHSRGCDHEEIVSLLMAATKAAAGDYGKRWNWRAEERAIRKDLAKLPAKYPKSEKTSSRAKPEIHLAAVDGEILPPSDEVRETVPALKNVSQVKAVPAVKDEPTHVTVGRAVLAIIEARGDAIMFTQKALWYCEGGLWRMTTDIDGWLNVQIQKAHLRFGEPSIQQRNEVRAWIKCQEPLIRRFEDVPWDGHGMVPCQSGLIDPRTHEVRPITPADFCTWMIGAEFDPTAECPWWLRMLDDVFADREPEERANIVRVLQELEGAGLLEEKPRELKKALVLQGGSNFGKSGLIEVLAGLFGKDQNSTTFDALEGTHGVVPFVSRAPWVLHEAFDLKKWHFSSKVKQLVTSEPIQADIKNGPIISVRFKAPIFWGTNHPPQFKESSRAITNRMVFIKCNREFFPDRPVGAALQAKKLGLSSPSELVLRDEKKGLLAWAMIGLKNALERGHLALSKAMTDDLDAINDESNLVAGFMKECVGYDYDCRLSVPDFCLAFSAWWLANRGETRTVPSNDIIGKHLLAMADPLIATDREELRDNKRRYYAGIVLNEAGLQYHDAGFGNRDLEGKRSHITEPNKTVNQPLPSQWLDKPSVKAMRERQVKDGTSMTRVVFPEDPEHPDSEVIPKYNRDECRFPERPAGR